MTKKIYIAQVDISKFFNDAWVEKNGNTIYLSYITNHGYIFIHEKGSITYTYAYKNKKEPYDIYNEIKEKNLFNLEKNEYTKIILEIIKQFDETIFPNPEPFKNQTKQNPISEYEKIILNLFSELKNRIYDNQYAKAKEYQNKNIKNIIYDPDGKFNTLTQKEPLGYDDYQNKRKELRIELTNTLHHLQQLYIENKNIQGYSDKEETKTKTLIDETKYIKDITEAISDTLNNPLYNLRYGIGKERVNIIDSVEEIIDEFGIKGVLKNNIETIYCYNDNLKYYEELSENTFKNMVVENYQLKLLPKDYKTIFRAIPTNDTEDTHILVFKNLLYDMDNDAEIYLNDETERVNYISSNLIGYEDDTDQIQLLDLDLFPNLKKIYSEKNEVDSMTYTEKILRQILIPKDDPSDLSLFVDFLQRLGSCIYGKNNYKTITLYYGDGNNGKGILKLLFELIYNNKAYSLTPETFTESFNLKSFLGRKCILLDEIDEKSLNDVKPMIKRISSPESRQEQRAIYSDRNIVLKNYPNMYIFSNVLLDFKLDELALFERFDFLKLPNTFTSEKKINKVPNSYIVDRQTEEKIKNDYEGLSWLISNSIRLFRQMEYSKQEYRRKQTIEETMDILINVDYLTKYIRIYTEKDENLIKTDYITNEQILQGFTQYMENKHKTIHETDNEIRRKIGSTIKSVYHISGKISDSDIYFKQDNRIASYQLRLKSTDEIEKDKNKQYKVNPDTINNLKYINQDTKNIYNQIKKGVNTINQLKTIYPKYNIEEKIYELLDLDLITKSDQTSLIDG